MTTITKYCGDQVTVHLEINQINVDASDNLRTQKTRGKQRKGVRIIMQRRFKATEKAAIEKYINELIEHERNLRGGDYTAKTSRSYGAKNIPGVQT